MSGRCLCIFVLSYLNHRLSHLTHRPPSAFPGGPFLLGAKIPKPETPNRQKTTKNITKCRYDSLKADLSVSLEETRGGADAVAFGAPSKNAGDRPWGTGGAGGPTTIADVIAAATSAGGSLSPGGEEGAPGEGQYLWGCTSPQEEREQLVSFVSLGCFDPSARLQVCFAVVCGVCTVCAVCRDAWLGCASAGSVADLLFDYPLLRLVLYTLSGCPARFIRSFFPAPSRRRPFAVFDFGFGGVDYIC